MSNELMIETDKMKQAYEDEESEGETVPEEPEVDDEGSPEDGSEVGDEFGTEEDKDEESPKDWVSVFRDVGETAGEESTWGLLDWLGTAGLETEELPTASWRLCSQRRISSTS